MSVSTQGNTQITTTTNQYLAPKVIDQILRDNEFFGEVMAATEDMKSRREYRGSQMLFPMKYQKGTSSVAFNGFDVLPITQTQTRVNMTFFPTFVAANVALAGTDLSVNDTADQILDLMQVEMTSRGQDLADDYGNLLYGTGAGKNPDGLGNIVDDGSIASSYGGLSRTTYAGLNATVTASGGTISLLKIRQLWNAVTDGSVQPTNALTDYTTWSFVEQLMLPFLRMTAQATVSGTREALRGDSGFKSLEWDGIKIHRDKKCPSGTFFMLNMEPEYGLAFYGLNYYRNSALTYNPKDIKGNIYTDRKGITKAFSWTGWVEAYNQAAVNGFIIIGGNLISLAPFRNGKLTGVTGI